MNLIPLNKIKTFDVLLTLVIIGGFFHQYIYILKPQLHLIRLVIPVALLWILHKKKLRVDSLGFLLIIFYVLFFVVTSVSSLIYYKQTVFTDYLNFFVATFLPLTLLLYGYFDTNRFLKVLFRVGIVLFFISLGIAFYEIVTLEHLKYSPYFGMNKNEWWNHMPGAFQGNPNDFMAVMIFIFSYTFAYLRLLGKKIHVLIEIVSFIIIVYLSFVTQSRLSQIVVFIFFLVYYKKYISRLKILLISIGISFISYFVFKEYFDDIIILVRHGLEVTEGGYFGAGLRSSLYLDGLQSLYNSYGIGYGISNWEFYYTQVLGHFNEANIYIPHSYLVEIAITGGLISFLVWCSMYFFYSRDIFLYSRITEVKVFVFAYFILMFSPSSCMFNYMYYVYFIAFAILLKQEKNLRQL